VNAQNVPTGMLVSYLQKGLQYREIETHLGEVRKNRQEQERKTRERKKMESKNYDGLVHLFSLITEWKRDKLHRGIQLVGTSRVPSEEEGRASVRRCQK
jgi:hypothetical protein